jgi:hypothetical protein
VSVIHNEVVAYTAEASGPAGTFVIRAEPRGIPHGCLGFVSSVRGLAFLRRLVTRNHSWVIRVRRWDDDPFGAVVYEERVIGKAVVPLSIARVATAIRGGDPRVR